jgi:hypothetical protein
MPAAENQRLVYRDKFRSLHCEAFQSWFEELAHALHPAGDFQAIRKTQGDGGLDGFVISSQLVYAVYAPARREEDRDSETAAKIRSDFAKACSTLRGQLKAWVFVHNHPEANHLRGRAVRCGECAELAEENSSDVILRLKPKLNPDFGRRIGREKANSKIRGQFSCDPAAPMGVGFAGHKNRATTGFYAVLLQN